MKAGGTIVLAASLTEGLGGPEFRDLLDEYRRAGRYRTMGGAAGRGHSIHADVCEMDEWQLLVFQKVMGHCKVKVVTGGLPADVIRACHVEPAESVEAAVAASLAEYGPGATLAVIPKGPYVLPAVGA